MKTEPGNIPESVRCIMEPGDSLSQLPSEFDHLLTDEIVAAFSSPVEHFLNVAQQTGRDSFSNLIQQFVSDSKWQFVAETGTYSGPTEAGFLFVKPNGKRIILRPASCQIVRPEFEEIHKYIEWLYWDDLGSGGQIGWTHISSIARRRWL